MEFSAYADGSPLVVEHHRENLYCELTDAEGEQLTVRTCWSVGGGTYV
jgi:hypothetical protein